MPLLSVFESDFLTNHSLVPTSLFELRRDKSDFRLLSWESGSCAPFKNGICDLHQTSIEIDWIAKTDIQTCINLAIFISRRIWVIAFVQPASAFTAAVEILFTRACGRWGSRRPNQPVFRADFVQNVCGIRTAPRPGRWRISSAEPKRVKKRSPQRWNGRSTRQKAGQYTAWDWRSASRPLPISGRLSRSGPFYLAHQAQGGHPVEAVLHYPQPEKDPPVWRWICIMEKTGVIWRRIEGNLADFIRKYPHWAENEK